MERVDQKAWILTPGTYPSGAVVSIEADYRLG
jgi:hypothetical protein